ncbi:hypothetical protein NC99_21250 [Sunxiuqinia dokdonensis]|uniref:Uncharacterized protein n=1 Tax=Sunxiuqinia dokdonensis TaxID=1409788 RepID=A0A0L8V935_9BACT|nr:hypothetical protein NC99_21250 [Sunxiuqinia dokdonensis]
MEYLLSVEKDFSEHYKRRHQNENTYPFNIDDFIIRFGQHFSS